MVFKSHTIAITHVQTKQKEMNLSDKKKPTKSRNTIFVIHSNSIVDFQLGVIEKTIICLDSRVKKKN